jgi:ABC-type lipoprotein export system ATPase subunit
MWTPSGTVPSCVSPLLSVRELTVKYGGGQLSVSAASDISLDLSQGEIVGILGESGSGKSTLALSILGLLPAKARVAGSIQFQDKDLLLLDESSWRNIRGAKISMIFQEPGLALSPVMRVGDQISEVIRAHRPGSRKMRKQECEELLNEVRLSDVDRIYKAYPHQLSGGQLHRVAIAQALACRPDHSAIRSHGCLARYKSQVRNRAHLHHTQSSIARRIRPSRARDVCRQDRRRRSRDASLPASVPSLYERIAATGAQISGTREPHSSRAFASDSRQPYRRGSFSARLRFRTALFREDRHLPIQISNRNHAGARPASQLF